MNYTSSAYLKKTIFFTILFLFGSLLRLYATHLRAGQITVEKVGGTCTRTFRITITVYTNTHNTTVLFGGDMDILDLGDNSDPDKDGKVGILVPEQQNIIRRDLNPDGSVATASYSFVYTYGGPGTYTISYREPNRNEGVLNMDNSVNTTFYLETRFTIDPFIGCNETPKLRIDPIDRACPGVAWFHNPGAYDPDGDSISFAMVIPFSDRNRVVVNYRQPNDPKFYTNYSAANEEKNGPPTFSIDPVTGTITWDAPGATGEYNIAFHVIEWRRVDNQWRQIGYVRRDMQILVEDCKNKRPDLIMPEDICVEAGQTVNAIIIGIDEDNDRVKIEAFSEIFEFAAAESPATYSPVPANNPDDPAKDFRPVPANTTFTWNTKCHHVKEQPYQVVFKITDNPPAGNGPKLVTFKTWYIKVVGPKPVWNTAVLDPVTRSATVAWEPYVCQNAESLQVWRKVEGTDFQPDNCQTGMPGNLGYELIEVLPVKENGAPVTQFLDTNDGKGLAPGAEYCYRLVAIFPLPRGGESYVSDDICVGPLIVDVPLVTKVSVLETNPFSETNPSSGKIKVEWVKPFEADPALYQEPYKYDVWRAEGFERGTDSAKIRTGISETEILDEEGLNTEGKVYNYSIVAYDVDDELLGSSVTASSVRLEAESQIQRIQLTWSAEVPWSNQISSSPTHIIYRGAENTNPDEWAVYANVNVAASGFVYVDENVTDNQTYCYRVETFGGYGNPNPLIPNPLRNFSQVICAMPGDSIPPCMPVPPVAQLPNCDDYTASLATCNQNIFVNVLTWDEPDREDDCTRDISYYNIYESNAFNGDYTLLATRVRGTRFEHPLSGSFANCYRITAVDRSQNESEMSDPVCFDNCPYYELPNMFSPNGDGCNDLFSAYSDRDIVGETGGGADVICSITSDESKAKCARFVERVIFRVYNRWGREVYSYEGSNTSESNNIFIDWDGRSSEGTELSTGIYYYVAEVTFTSIDPRTKYKTLKGWIHLLRSEN